MHTQQGVAADPLRKHSVSSGKPAKIRQNDRALEATAYHEAGHAVAALTLGVGVGSRGVSIRPGDGFSGFLHMLSDGSLNPNYAYDGGRVLKAERRAVVSLAGEVAQRKHAPSGVRHHHGVSDREAACLLLEARVGSNAELNAYLKLLHIRAKQLIEHRWPFVEAIAAALLEHTELSRSQLLQLRQECIRNRVAGA